MSLSKLLYPALLIAVLGCSGTEDVNTELQKVSDESATDAKVAVQLNWYPESEHGGLYQALADGTYEHAGLAVDLRPGGRSSPVGPELELQRCAFAVANADDVALFRQQEMDIVAVLAAMQDHPRCILVREDSGVTEFEELAGMTLQRQAGRGFVEFLRSRGLLEGVHEVPYHGSVASLVADPKIAIQGYSFAEPLLAEQQGVKVRTLMVSELGFNPYSSVLITTGTMIREQPEFVRRFVQATREGWQNYLTDPSQGNTAILTANKHGMTAEALEFGSQGLQALAMPNGFTKEKVGMMSADRWNTLVKQMADLNLVSADKVRAEDCYTIEFLD